jgi:CPA2 family monovalent cation:H+ antiporter-2
VVRIVRATRPDIPIVVRTTDDKDVARLKSAGATEVIPEVLESSLLIAAETLVQAGIPMEHAIQHVRSKSRAERYASLREFYRARIAGRLACRLATTLTAAFPA